MKSIAGISSVLLAWAAPFGAEANPGLHVHPHPVESAQPLLPVHPILGLLLIIVLWAATVRAIETVSARLHSRA
jgi:hypothetical protein